MEPWEDEASIRNEVVNGPSDVRSGSRRDCESQWAVICSVAGKLGCTAETLLGRSGRSGTW